MKPTPDELNLIVAMAVALRVFPPGSQPIASHATGTVASFDRQIVVDFGSHDIGPIIGSGGMMKMAIQTILAYPRNTDAVQLEFRTKRIIRPTIMPAREPVPEPVAAVIAAISCLIEPVESINWKVETSPTAVVVLIQASQRFARSLRPALNRIFHAIGRVQGFPVTLSVDEPTEEPRSSEYAR